MAQRQLNRRFRPDQGDTGRMDPWTRWIAKAIIEPEARARALTFLTQRHWVDQLSRSAAKHVGVRRAGRATRRWLDQEETWEGLVDPREEALEQLTASLESYLRQSVLFVLGGGTGDARAIAEKITRFARANLIQSLDPSVAVSVADERNAIRFDALLQDGATPVATLRARLPPPCRMWIERLDEVDAPRARQLARFLADHRLQVREGLKDLVANPPRWMKELPYQGWVALGEFADAHGVHDAALQAFLNACDLEAPDRDRWVRRAATAAHNAGDETRARDLLDGLRDAPSTRALRALLAHDWNEVSKLPRAPEGLSCEDAPGYLVVKAEAEVQRSDYAAAIALFEAALSASPESAGTALRLAQLLIWRAEDAASSVRARDLSRAHLLALTARDLRRAWNGPSEEAVAVLCDVAAFQGDYAGGLRFALPQPEGEAWEREAQSQLVVTKACSLALLGGELQLARSLSGGIQNAFERLRLQGAFAEAVDKTDEAEDAFRGAWDCATTTEERRAIQQALAAIGAWPVPGLGDLRKEDPNFATELEAVACLSSERYEDAVRLLRGVWTTSRRAASLLLDAYMLLSNADSAVATATDASERFGDPTLILRVCRWLAKRGMWEHVEKTGQELLGSSAFLPTHQRQELRAFLVDAAVTRHDWSRVERHALAAVAEDGDDVRAKWTVLGAQLNAGRQKQAWETFSEYQPLEAATAEQFQIALELYRFHGSSAEHLERVIEIAEKNTACEEVWGSALITAHTMPTAESVPQGTIDRLRTSTAAFTTAFPESRYFRGFDAESPEGAVEQIKSVIPRRGAAVRELTQKVAEGELPMGILASTARKPYAEVIFRRGAGCLPLASTDPAFLESQEAALRSALDGDVVVDASFLHAASILPPVLAFARAECRRLIVLDLTLRDLQRARAAFSRDEDTTVVIDEETDELQAVTVPEDVLADLRNRSSWAVEIAEQLTPRTWTNLKAVGAVVEGLTIERDGEWLAPIDFAKSSGITLACDDVGLASLAGSLGVLAFGTVSVLNYLRREGRMTDREFEDSMTLLARNYAVDLPGQLDRVFELAEAEAWVVGASSFALTRRQSWIDRNHAISRLLDVVRRAHEVNPEHAYAWFSAGMFGCLKTVPPSQRVAGAAELIRVAMGDRTMSPEHLPGFLTAARSALRELGEEGDPLDPLVRSLDDALRDVGSRQVASQIIMEFVAGLEEPDRRRVVQILLHRGGGA